MMNESDAFYSKKGKGKIREDDDVGGDDDEDDDPKVDIDTVIENVETTDDERELATGKVAQFKQERAQMATDDNYTNPNLQ